MLKLFRTNTLAQVLIILLVSVLLWLRAFLHPLPAPIYGGGDLFYWMAGKLSPWLATLLGYLVVLAGGVLLSSLMYRHKLVSQGTLLPTLLYVVAMSLGHPTLTPFSVAALLMILCADQLMLTSTLLSIDIGRTFGAAASLSLATLFCPTAVVFAIPLLLNMFNFSLYSWRDWTMLLLGLIAPYLLLETCFYVADNLFYHNYLLLYSLTDLRVSIDGTLPQWLTAIAFVLLLLVGLIGGGNLAQGSTATMGKNITTLLLFATGGIAYLFYTSIVPLPAEVFSIPFACGLTLLLSEPRRKETGANLLLVGTLLVFVILNLWGN